MFGLYRTLLALLVVAQHIGGIPNVGCYAVFGFYCLSGYLMTLIMHENYGFSLSGTYKYAVNRVLRIYPIYWLSVLLTLSLIWLYSPSELSDYHAAMYLPEDFVGILKNIFIFFPFRESPILTPPSWALTVELFFYVLIGLGLSQVQVSDLGLVLLECYLSCSCFSCRRRLGI